MFETVKNLIQNKQIPALELVQMLARLQYLFAPMPVSARTRIAETVYRNDRDHSGVFEPFLTLRLVHRRITAAQEVN